MGDRQCCQSLSGSRVQRRGSTIQGVEDMAGEESVYAAFAAPVMTENFRNPCLRVYGPPLGEDD